MRILIVAFANAGFLFPLVGIACELRDRGHDIAFLTHEDGQALCRVSGVTTLLPGDARIGALNVRRWFSRRTVASATELCADAIDVFEPDVLVSHALCLGPVLAGRLFSIPLAVLGFFSYPYPIDAVAETAGRKARLDAELDLLRAVGADLSIDAPIEREALLGDLYLLRSAPEVEPHSSVLPKEVAFIGALTWDPPTFAERSFSPPPELLERIGRASGRQATVYIQNGTGFGEGTSWRSLLEAIAEMDITAVASTGRMEVTPGDLPPNVIAYSHIAHREVLPRCAAVIGGGHSSLVLGAITHSLPGLFVPKGGETYPNVARLARFGCALYLEPAAASAAVFRNQLGALFESSATMRESVGRLRDLLQPDSALRSAVLSIEALGERTARHTLPIATNGR